MKFKNKFVIVVADPPWSFVDKLQHSDVKRGAQAQYDTMTMQEIRELPIEKICNPRGAVLCLWVPSSLLQDGLDIMKNWGFSHKQTYVWVKVKKDPLLEIRNIFFDHWKKGQKTLSQLKEKGWKQFIQSSTQMVEMIDLTKGKSFMGNMLAFGMGRLFRQTHEICLIGTSNNKIYRQLKNKSQRSVCFAENLKHSAKPEALQDSLDIMFPTGNKIELFARRVRPNWTCLGNEIDGKDIRDALVDL